MRLTRRSINALGALACALMLGYAYYAERGLGLEPCPLCMFQRVGIGLLGIAFLAAALHAPAARAGRVAYAVLIGSIALFPIYVAARHVWIQSQPAGAVPACGATLDYMLEVFPLMTVVRKVLTGGGECTKIDWSFLGLSMPAWVLVAAVVLAALALYNNLRHENLIEPSRG